ncbi:ECF RNA polymerase sigma factor SigE [mine drainage metagenome]|uniref:ECF RNA polymerase sigma factor SigE n=1 Tax=mine drainage metagenome TaxID=410659 RepID=A0A1J5SJA6_9ZZZZ
MSDDNAVAPADEVLMSRVRATADAAAFNELMVRWEIRVKRYLARVLQNQAEAEDLAQEAFVRIYSHRDRYRDGARFSAWLYAIAANLARNRLRWWRRRPSIAIDSWSPDEDRPAPVEIADPAAGASVVEGRERALIVRDAVAALPLRLREVVVLCEYEALSQAEAAEVLGTTAKAVETRLYRARAILRTKLAALAA